MPSKREKAVAVGARKWYTLCREEPCRKCEAPSVAGREGGAVKALLLVVGAFFASVAFAAKVAAPLPPPSQSLLAVSDPFTSVMAFKLADDRSGAAILRLVEMEGIDKTVTVKLPFKVSRAVRCNIIEDNNELAAQQGAGAWLGGTIDTTAAVAASGALLGEVAGETAVIVKASQNVLLGLAAFAISLFWSVRDTGNVMETKGSVIWHRFPKFVLGMVVASAVFSIWFKGGVEIDGAMVKYKAIAKNFQGIFFSIAFVCIGLETRFKEIFTKENRASLKAFLTAQTFNIIFTFIVAVTIFGFIAN